MLPAAHHALTALNDLAGSSVPYVGDATWNVVDSTPTVIWQDQSSAATYDSVSNILSVS